MSPIAWLRRASESPGGRLLLIAVAFVVGAVPYPFFNALLVPRFDFLTEWDRAIPFLPWTIVVYWSWPLLLGAAARAVRGPELLRLLGGLLVCAALCYAGFALLPARYPRPAPERLASPIWRRAYCWLDAFDGTGNTLPSLHVALTCFTALELRRRRRGWLWIAAAALLSLSTLTVKQHFIVDVAAGAGVAGVVHLALRALARGRG